MQFRHEYWQLEGAVRDKALELNLMDDAYEDKLAEKSQKREEAFAHFSKWFLPEYRAMPHMSDELNLFQVGTVVRHIYDRYFDAFCQKTAYGERYAELHLDPRPFRNNLGDKIGTSMVDIVTSDAVSWLTSAVIYDEQAKESRELTDQEAMKILGSIVKHTIQSLASVGMAPRENLMEPYILVVNPQPQGLKMRPEDFAKRIWHHPETAAESWADAHLIGKLKYLGERDGFCPGGSL